MMKRLAFLVALTVGLAGPAFPAAAGTHKTPAATPHSLRVQLRGLRAQVRSLIAERNALQAALERATEPRVEGKPKTKLPRLRTPVAIAVAQVRHEVEWAEGSTEARLRGQLVAEAAMDYVVGHVSTGEYGYLELVYGQPPGGPKLPPYFQSVNLILATQTGICVQAERTFARIVESLGFRVRDIGFDFGEPSGEADSHAAAEVFYDGAWHFFDPTFGQFWTDAGGTVLSIKDVRASGGIEHRDAASFTNVIEDADTPEGNDTWYETDPSTKVVGAGE